MTKTGDCIWFHHKVSRNIFIIEYFIKSTDDGIVVNEMNFLDITENIKFYKNCSYERFYYFLFNKESFLEQAKYRYIGIKNVE